MSVNAKARRTANNRFVPQQSANDDTPTAAPGTVVFDETATDSTPPAPSPTATDSSSSTTQPPQPSYTQPSKRIPLLTTFTPDSSCSNNYLSQLPPPGYLIWANEPVPAPDVTYTGCYPYEFLREYTSVSSGTVGSSIVPAMGPMVCPKDWCTMYAGDNNYAVCCPSGYRFHRPDSTIDPRRPGYGGTCYSDFTVSSTYTVTAFNVSGATIIAEWAASTPGAQAYAHPIDGFGAKTPVVGCAARKSAKSAAGLIAGVTIAGLAALASLLVLALLLLRHIKKRRRENMRIEHVQHDMGQPALRCTVVCEKEGSPVSAEAPLSEEKWDFHGRTSEGVNRGWGHFELPAEAVAELDGASIDKKGTARKETDKYQSIRPIPPDKDTSIHIPKSP